MNNTINKILNRLIAQSLLVTFLTVSVVPPGYAQTQPLAPLNLPVPGTLVGTSPAFVPANLIGLKVDPLNPLNFNFLINTGDENLSSAQLTDTSDALVRYFLASLAIPEEDMWVNLSPYEQDRVIEENFAQTAMGRDLLAQDYILKQLTASLLYPEGDLGKAFWQRIRQKADALGLDEIPTETFHKIWITPDSATVFEDGDSVYVTEARLKVLLEEDYLKQQRVQSSVFSVQSQNTEHRTRNTEIMREVIIPAIETEVNHGESFARLRQIYHAMVLATWFKQSLEESLIGQVYADQSRVKGIAIDDPDVDVKIYNQYIDSIKQGAFNFIKEEYDPATQSITSQKYFSGGFAPDASALKTLDATGLMAAPPDVRRAVRAFVMDYETAVADAAVFDVRVALGESEQDAAGLSEQGAGIREQFVEAGPRARLENGQRGKGDRDADASILNKTSFTPADKLPTMANKDLVTEFNRVFSDEFKYLVSSENKIFASGEEITRGYIWSELIDDDLGKQVQYLVFGVRNLNKEVDEKELRDLLENADRFEKFIASFDVNSPGFDQAMQIMESTKDKGLKVNNPIAYSSLINRFLYLMTVEAPQAEQNKQAIADHVQHLQNMTSEMKRRINKRLEQVDAAGLSEQGAGIREQFVEAAPRTRLENDQERWRDVNDLLSWMKAQQEEGKLEDEWDIAVTSYAKYGHVAIYHLIRDIKQATGFRGAISPQTFPKKINNTFGIHYSPGGLTTGQYFALETVLKRLQEDRELSTYGNLGKLDEIVEMVLKELDFNQEEEKTINLRQLTLLINSSKKVGAIVGAQVSNWNMPKVDMTRARFQAISTWLREKHKQGVLFDYGSEEGLVKLLVEIENATGEETLVPLQGINLGHLTGLLNSEKNVGAIIGAQVIGWGMPLVDMSWKQFKAISTWLKEKHTQGVLSDYGSEEGLVKLLVEIENATDENPLSELRGMHLTKLTGLINSEKKVGAIVEEKVTDWNMPFVNMRWNQFKMISDWLKLQYANETLMEYGSEEGLIKLLLKIENAKGNDPLVQLQGINLKYLTGLINSGKQIGAIIGVDVKNWAVPFVDMTWDQFQAISTWLKNKYEQGTLSGYGSEEGLAKLLIEIHNAIGEDPLVKLKGMNLKHLTELINSGNKVGAIVGIPSEQRGPNFMIINGQRVEWQFTVKKTTWDEAMAKYFPDGVPPLDAAGLAGDADASRLNQFTQSDDNPNNVLFTVGVMREYLAILRELNFTRIEALSHYLIAPFIDAVDINRWQSVDDISSMMRLDRPVANRLAVLDDDFQVLIGLGEPYQRMLRSKEWKDVVGYVYETIHSVSALKMLKNMTEADFHPVAVGETKNIMPFHSSLNRPPYFIKLTRVDDDQWAVRSFTFNHDEIFNGNMQNGQVMRMKMDNTDVAQGQVLQTEVLFSEKGFLAYDNSDNGAAAGWRYFIIDERLLDFELDGDAAGLGDRAAYSEQRAAGGDRSRLYEARDSNGKGLEVEEVSDLATATQIDASGLNRFNISFDDNNDIDPQRHMRLQTLDGSSTAVLVGQYLKAIKEAEAIMHKANVVSIDDMDPSLTLAQINAMGEKTKQDAYLYIDTLRQHANDATAETITALERKIASIDIYINYVDNTISSLQLFDHKDDTVELNSELILPIYTVLSGFNLRHTSFKKPADSDVGLAANHLALVDTLRNNPSLRDVIANEVWQIKDGRAFNALDDPKDTERLIKQLSQRPVRSEKSPEYIIAQTRDENEKRRFVKIFNIWSMAAMIEPMDEHIIEDFPVGVDTVLYFAMPDRLDIAPLDVTVSKSEDGTYGHQLPGIEEFIDFKQNEDFIVESDGLRVILRIVEGELQAQSLSAEPLLMFALPDGYQEITMNPRRGDVDASGLNGANSSTIVFNGINLREYVEDKFTGASDQVKSILIDRFFGEDPDSDLFDESLAYGRTREGAHANVEFLKNNPGVYFKIAQPVGGKVNTLYNQIIADEINNMIRINAAFESTNIPRFVNWGVTDNGDLWFSAVGIEDGFSLQSYLKYNKDPHEMIALIHKAINIVKVLRDNGFYHGDLELINFIINERNEIMLIDFPEAERTESWDPDTTKKIRLLELANQDEEDRRRLKSVEEDEAETMAQSLTTLLKELFPDKKDVITRNKQRLMDLIMDQVSGELDAKESTEELVEIFRKMLGSEIIGSVDATDAAGLGERGADSVVRTAEDDVRGTLYEERVSDVGGIDLDSRHLNLQIKRNGDGVPLPVHLQDLQDINIDGLFPVIINITPVTSVPLLFSKILEDMPDAEHAALPDFPQLSYAVKP